MPSVKDELNQLKLETDSLLNLAEQQSGVSNELLSELSGARDEVNYALEDYQSITESKMTLLAGQVRGIEANIIRAIRDSNQELSGEAFLGGMIGGFLSLLGNAASAAVIRDSIEKASRRPRRTDAEEKERALISLIFRLERSGQFLTFTDIVDKSADESIGILTKLDARRITTKLIENGSLEVYSSEGSEGLRLSRSIKKRLTRPKSLLTTDIEYNHLCSVFEDWGMDFSSLYRQYSTEGYESFWIGDPLDETNRVTFDREGDQWRPRSIP
jgi:hypothetical protein